MGTATYHYLRVLSSWVSLYISTWQFRHLLDHYLPLPDSSIILGTTTYLYQTVPSSWGPLPTTTWQFFILVTTTRLCPTVPSSCEPLPTSVWQFHHSGDRNATLPDSPIILGSTTHFYLTVLLSCGPLPTSTWEFHLHGDNFKPLPDHSIIWDSTGPFGHIGDHCTRQHDCSSILLTTIYVYLTVSASSLGPLPISTWLLHHPGYHYTLNLTVPWSWVYLTVL